MSKNKKIQFWITEEDYNLLYKEANINNESITELARRKLLHGNTDLTPRTYSTMCGIYNLLKMPHDLWNGEMERNYKEGMRYLYDVLKNSK